MPRPSTLLNQWLRIAYDDKKITYDEKNEIQGSSEVFYHIAETKKISFDNTTWNPDFFIDYGEWFESWLSFLADKHVVTKSSFSGRPLF